MTGRGCSRVDAVRAITFSTLFSENSKVFFGNDSVLTLIKVEPACHVINTPTALWCLPTKPDRTSAL